MIRLSADAVIKDCASFIFIPLYLLGGYVLNRAGQRMALSCDGKAETFSYFRVGVGGQEGGIISRHHMAFHLGDPAPKFDKNPSIGRYYLLSAEGV